MMNTFNKLFFGFLLVMFLTLQSCQQPVGNSTGSEYMPDMAHSIAYESNYYNYYYNNTWGGQDEYYKFAQPRLPVSGTIARGGSNPDADQKVVPYYYGNTEEERTRATNELINSPVKITDAGLRQGKELYNTFCGICHGDKADGAGYLVRDDGGKYPVQPAILNSEEFKAASNGRYYHAIMYGKNVMGAYKDKISFEERWHVIHYIRSLHAKEDGKVYTQMENTLNDYDEPAGEYAVVDIPMTQDDPIEAHQELEAVHSDGEEGSHDTDQGVDHQEGGTHKSEDHKEGESHDGH